MTNSASSTQNVPKKKILLVSGYDAASHRHWRQTLQHELPQFFWTQIALPDRFYAWRIRGNAICLANQFESELNGDYDCLIVTSMVDLNSLRGFVPKLAKLPTIVYCHENQFVYPSNSQPQEEANRLNAQLSALFTMRCADIVLFNSNYNHSSFFKGAERLFKKLPDGVSISEIEQIQLKSSVLPVPIKVANADIAQDSAKKYSQSTPTSERQLSIVWNHRWEFDKNPEVFFAAIKQLAKQKLKFRLHVLGQSFRKVPDCFASAKIELAAYIDSWGFQSRSQYDQILSEADIVVSTAAHDFQGLSMLEAINLGCFPVAPDRVAYPEYIDKELLYSASSASSESQALALRLQQLMGNWSGLTGAKALQFRQLASQYTCEYLIPKYQRVIESACNSKRIKSD